MKIFLSWSGTPSKQIALLFKEWIPSVIQRVDCFISDELEKGTVGLDTIASELNASNCGIICLTPTNLEAQWINFEAGALSKILDRSRVWTYLSELDHTDVTGPLSKFQHTRSNREDLYAMLRSINNFVDGEKLNEARLRKSFDAFYPDFLSSYENILNESKGAHPVKRSQEDMVAEILEVVRGLATKRSSNVQFLGSAWDVEPSLILEHDGSLTPTFKIEDYVGTPWISTKPNYRDIITERLIAKKAKQKDEEIALRQSNPEEGD